jgi:hypothetical protein
MKHQNRFFTLVLVMLCLCLLAGCATVGPSAPEERPDSSGPLDGEIGSNPSEGDRPGSSKPGYSEDSEAADGDMPMSPTPPSEPEFDDAPDMEGMPGIPGDGTIGGGNGTGFEQQAGQLTGSEWNDNDHFAEFVDKINAQGNGWYEIAAKWNQIATKRIYVRLHNGQDKAVPLAVVSLLNAEGGVLWSAVTDADGDAYLFYHVSPTITSSMEALIPASSQVSAPDGKRMTHQLRVRHAPCPHGESGCFPAAHLVLRQIPCPGT